MFTEGNFSRVYWAGAAMALQADVALRSGPGNGTSLDDALGRLAGCCGVVARPWSCAKVMGKLDELGRTGVFGGVLERAHSGPMPDLTETLSRLGVQIDADERVRFVDAPLANVRDAIMAPRG